MITRSPAKVLIRFFLHLAGGVRDDLMADVKRNAKARVGQRFDHGTVEFQELFFWPLSAS